MKDQIPPRYANCKSLEEVVAMSRKTSNLGLKGASFKKPLGKKLVKEPTLTSFFLDKPLPKGVNHPHKRLINMK